MSNVKIALRVRPLTEKELNDERSSKIVVEVEDEKTVAITNLKVSPYQAGDSRERVKRFSFDYCFDSSQLRDRHSFATQEMVYEKLGAIVTESLCRGRDTCVLAYGQSASGKTYTMQGTDTNPGLTPRLCSEIMNTSQGDHSMVYISYLEIYNERVRDLLGSGITASSYEGKDPNDTGQPSANQIKGLRIREHPNRGPYVEGLSEISVKSGETLCSMVKIGSSRRKAAATQRNPDSSRSHALLAVRKENPPVTLTLIDLAGSERPSRVNQSISRQKEGANINKSLVALANVISALASPISRGSRYVPYRDSALTWLLKDTLSGDTTTIMIATVSPSSTCYSETVNTMRWAARAGRIPSGLAGGGGVPRTAERSLRALRAEVARLRALLITTAADKINARPQPQLVDQTTQACLTPPIEEEIEEEEDQYLKEAAQRSDEASDGTIKEETAEANQQDQEGDDSINSLASSRVSIVSNDGVTTAQGSGLNSAQTEDILFGPRLNRAGSVHDFKPLPPLRNKSRQYGSHEALSSPDKNSTLKSKTPVVRLNKNAMNRLGDREKIEKFNSDKSERPNNPPEEQTKNSDSQKQHVTYEPFNKRAVVVASVTDRLYSLSKKKEEAMLEGNGNPVLNRKRLFDLSYRALRATRRIRIGVPAETQTDEYAIRVKEIGTDIQNDIEPPHTGIDSGKQYRNTGVETEIMTTRCKEAAVGTPGGSIYNDDKCIETDRPDPGPTIILTKTCGNMTDEYSSNTSSTQTHEFAPPRKKYSSFTKYLKFPDDNPSTSANDKLSPQMFSISISHDCNSFENEADCISDDSLESDIKVPDLKSQQAHITPDLLNNHNSIENGTIRNDAYLPNSSIKSNHDPAKGSIQNSHASCDDNVAKDSNKGGNLISAKCTINRNEIVPECRDIWKTTNSNGLIQNKTGVNINQRCDRVTDTGEEVIKQPGVTWRISQSPRRPIIQNTDTIKANKNVGTDEMKNEDNFHESEPTQFAHTVEPCCSDFLEDIYVPLPRICVTSDCATEQWPHMRNLILGRNENSYPYNIKLSPKRMDTSNSRKTKTVSWKNCDDLCSKNTNRRSTPKRIFKTTTPCINHGHVSPNSYCRSIDSDSDIVEIGDCSHNDKTSCGPHSIGSHFKGVHCWSDRTRTPIVKPTYNISRHIQRYNHRQENNYETKCLQYMEATSNLIKEAANLVSSLSKNPKATLKTEKENQSDSLPSPIGNERLQVVDENHKSDKEAAPEYEYSEPSTSNNPHIINDELMNTEEDTNINNKVFNSDENFISSDEDDLLNPLSDQINQIEQDLLTSMDHLEAKTDRTSEYFSTVSRRFADTFDRELTSLPPSLPMPYPRMRRNPSKYLEELLKLRKEVVESTKRDEIIYKQFQTNYV